MDEKETTPKKNVQQRQSSAKKQKSKSLKK